MSFTLASLASLRVLVGVVGFGYSMYSRGWADDSNQEKTNFNQGKLLEAIYGGSIGNLIYDFIKGGAFATADLINKIERHGGIDELNHDLQRAARKAQLMATWFACQSCLGNLRFSRSSYIKRLKNIVINDDDIRWLIAVSRRLKEEIDALPNAVFDNNLNYQELFQIFDKDKIINTETSSKEFAEKIKEENLKEVKSNYYSKFFGQIAIESQSGYEMLEDAIKNGWNEFNVEEDSAGFIKLNISNLQPNATGKKYDWFQLVCIIFNEEFNNNPKIQAAIQKREILEIKSLLLASDGLGYLGKLENKIDDLIFEVLAFKEEALNLLYEIRHDIQRLERFSQESADKLGSAVQEVNENLKSVKELLEKNSSWEIIDKEFLRKASINYTKNDAKSFFNIREPNWADANSDFISKRKIVYKIKERIEKKINAQQTSIIQIIGNAGEGKSTVFYQVICELINTNPNLHILFPKFDDNNLEFSPLVSLINSPRNYLIALDNSYKFSNKLNTFLRKVSLHNKKNVHFILCCRTNEWDISENNWKIYFPDFEPIEIVLSSEDAKSIVESWLKLEGHNNKILKGKTIDEVSNDFFDYCHRNDNLDNEGNTTSFLVGLDKLANSSNLIDGIINFRENLNVESYIIKLLKDIKPKGKRILDIYFCIATLDAEGFKILVSEILSKRFNTNTNEINQTLKKHLKGEVFQYHYGNKIRVWGSKQEMINL